ncbi:translocation/assembly module TamB domain-containing protein [Roseovarius autotrophicus]|uniref:translocation/assembly module TamB domain-containing protein n=1 Tax=Roseovarius autotrophicus TaxID=2824121 RepID=UPI0019FD87B3|nr:translocation/assembly module TamB domain-containing protein [Roseovarius autotrophicus]MBE0452327.1 translocation/assembly module TamB domain-containing protein [Roseovarius sp.]
MRALLLLSLVLTLFAAPLPAQQVDEDSGGFLEQLLEDNLSAVGRDVRIRGFVGALSSQATMAQMTIADAEGVWLRLSGVTLDWSRAALLRGRVEVNRLTAQEIEIVRPPQPGPEITPEIAEARPFSLPELPVSINIGELTAETVILGAPLLGEEIRLSITGAITLGSGEGSATLEARRLDGRGAITLDAGFANATRVLALDLAVDEAPGGIAATLLNLPGAPALALSVTGTAPLDDYAADIRLATDGTDRLTGRVAVTAPADANSRFSATLDGDLTPLLPEEFRPFFGPQSALAITGSRTATGRTEIDRLSLSAAQFSLEGNLALDAANWPERFNLTGEIGNGEAPVRLPVADPPTEITGATLTARYDAARGDRWRLEATLSGLTQPDLRLETATVRARGALLRIPPRGVTALTEFSLLGLAPTDPALAQATGPALTGHATIDWREGGPLVLRAFRANAGDATLSGSAEIAALTDGFPVTGRVALSAEDLARFAPLAGQPLEGRASAAIAGSGSLLGGAFDLTITGETDRLALGIPQIDPLIAPPGTLALTARRDTTGTTLDRLLIRNAEFTGTAEGRLSGQSGALTITAALADLGLADRRLDGPARVAGDVGWQAGGDVTLTGLKITAMGAVLDLTGTLSPEMPGLPVAGRLTAEISDLARFAALTGQPLAGRIDATLTGQGVIENQTGTITLDAQSTGLALGIAQLDPLIASTGTLHVNATHDGATTTLRALRLAYDKLRLTASGTGEIAAQTGEVTFDAGLTDLSPLDAHLSGAGTAKGTVARDAGGTITLTALEAEAMGATLAATGTVNPETPAATGTLSARIADLARFNALSGQRLAGSLDLTAEGSGEGESLRVKTTLAGRDLATGIADLDRLIAGRLELSADAGRTPERIEITEIRLATPQLTLDARGDGAGGPVTLDARLANLGLFLPEFPGPLATRGTVTLVGPEARRIALALDATGPGGTTARVSGDVLDHGARLDLATSGRLPLALINRFIQPNALSGTAEFDLRAQGAPALAALSGTVRTSGTQVSLPDAGLAIDDLSGSATLGQSRATTDFTARLRDGGAVRITGPVSLVPDYAGDLTVALLGTVLSDRLIYTTTANGAVTLNGPLTGGARIGGEITLEETNIRIPSGLGPASVSLPDLRHINESAASRLTRERAGLLKETTASAPRRAFQLALTINAPSRIFVRGRGLDAELGGRLRIGGTSADVSPAGFFELRRGRLDILGKRLTLTEGRVTIQGSLDPWLRFVARTRIDDTEVQVIIEGLASAPEVTFASNPDLPQEEIVARLIFGRGLGDISPLQAAQLASAVATLSGGGGDLVGRLRGGLGLADLDVSQTADGDTQVSAGTYLSDKVYTEVTADSTGKQRINLNLDLTRSLTVKGGASNDGDSGIGIFFERDY